MRKWTWSGTHEHWYIGLRTDLAAPIGLLLVNRVTLGARRGEYLEQVIPRFKAQLDWVLGGTFLVDKRDEAYADFYRLHATGAIRLRQVSTWPHPVSGADIVDVCYGQLKELTIDLLGTTKARRALLGCCLELEINNVVYGTNPSVQEVRAMKKGP